MSWILALTIGVTFAIVCAQMARTRKRDVVVWTALGFVTGIFAVIVLPYSLEGRFSADAAEVS